MHIVMSEEAHEAWHLFARAQGVSVTGLVNALGEELSEVDERRLPAMLRRAVVRAREVDAERRRRPGR